MKLFLLLLSSSYLFLANNIESEIKLSNPMGTDAVISSNYGIRNHPILKNERMHNGIDFRAKIGTPVFASADGKVVFSDLKGTSGKLIEIEHKDGFKTIYAHLSEFKEGVKNGLMVKAGDIIAYSGETGLTNEPHLHFELILDGKAIDPVLYLE